MNKHQFMASLQHALSSLDQAAVLDILADFEEHFTAGQSRGKSEEAIAAELGDPFEIGRQYVDASDEKTGSAAAFKAAAIQAAPAQSQASQATDTAQQRPAGESGQPQTPAAPTGKLNESALIGVILLNLLIGIPLWLGLFAALAGLWAGAGSIGAAAVVLFMIAVFQAGVVSLILILFAVALSALTILAVILMVYLTKWLVLGLAAWFRWNRRLVYGGATV